MPLSHSEPLQQLHPDLFTVEHHAWQGPLHVQLRMTCVRVDGQLLLHSAVPIDDALAAELTALGPVAHIVAPNKFHHLFARAAAERFGEATFWAAPGLRKKIKGLPDGPTLGEDDAPWAHAFAPFPLRGNRFIGETAFYHRPSRSLVCTDAFFNVVEPEPSWLSRMVFGAIGVRGPHRMSRPFKLFSRDRAAMKASLEALLLLELDRIIMAHGSIVEEAPADALRQAAAWLLD